MIMNKSEKLEYNDLNKQIIPKTLIQNDIIDSIKNLNKNEYDSIFKMNKIWIHPYINYDKDIENIIPYKYTYKFYDGAKLSIGRIIGGDTGYIGTLLQRFSKLDMTNDIFNFLNTNFNILSDKKYTKKIKKDLNLWNSAPEKVKLIQIVFRIKNKLSKDNRYFINSELNNLKIK